MEKTWEDMDANERLEALRNEVSTLLHVTTTRGVEVKKLQEEVSRLERRLANVRSYLTSR